MYPWIASPAMAKVVAFEFMRAEHEASRARSGSARAPRAPREDVPAAVDVPAPTAATPRVPSRFLRALHLAH